jgi:phosphoadenosine phosphosulfate reductase
MHGGKFNIMHLSEKENTGIEAIARALSSGQGLIAAFGGGKDSVVLLHLIKRAGDGGINLPVLTLDPPKELHRLYYFIDKMAGLWNFGGSWVRKKAGQDEGGIPECDSLFRGLGTIASSAASDGYGKLLSGVRKDEEGAGSRLSGVNVVAGFTFINPLAEFTEDDIFEYLERHNVPCCSLYRAGRKKLGCIPAVHGVKPPEYSEEEDLVRSRLSALGYI